MVYNGPLKCWGSLQGDSRELLIFLLDYVLLMVKQKSKRDQFKVYQWVHRVLHFGFQMD